MARTSGFVQIVLVVFGYWTVSIWMVFANKYLVGSRDMPQDMSLFVAWIQCIVCVSFISIYTLIGQALGLGTKVPAFSISKLSDVKMLQLSACFVLMLTFNNLCLKLVGVAFFQVARSMTLIFTVILSAVLLNRYTSCKSIFCCILIVCGFLLGVDQEQVAGTLSVKGVAFGIATSVFVSLTGILTKRALDLLEVDSVKLTFYNNLNGIIMFFPLVLITDQFSAVMSSGRLYDPYFWLALVFSGIMAFCMSIVSTLQIHFTSPIAHHISNNAKSVIQTIIAVTVYNDYKGFLWWTSNFIVIAGALGYALNRLREEHRDNALPVNESRTVNTTRNI